MSFSSIVFGNNVITDKSLNKDKEEKISISEIHNGTANITWTELKIDAIEIISNNGIFMPEFPVLEASSLHLSYLESGIYTIKFKFENEVIYEKIIEVQR